MSNEMPMKKQSFLGGAAVLALATAVVKLIGMFFKIPLQMVIHEAGYGYFTTAYDIYSVLLMISTTGLPVGVAFAFWEGLGLTLITLSSVLILNEALTLKRVLGLICVLAGALLVHHGTGHGESRKPRPRDAKGGSSPGAESTDAAPGAGRP